MSSLKFNNNQITIKDCQEYITVILFVIKNLKRYSFTIPDIKQYMKDNNDTIDSSYYYFYKKRFFNGCKVNINYITQHIDEINYINPYIYQIMDRLIINENKIILESTNIKEFYLLFFWFKLCPFNRAIYDNKDSPIKTMIALAIEKKQIKKQDNKHKLSAINDYKNLRASYYYFYKDPKDVPYYKNNIYINDFFDENYNLLSKEDSLNNILNKLYSIEIVRELSNYNILLDRNKIKKILEDLYKEVYGEE